MKARKESQEGKAAGVPMMCWSGWTRLRGNRSTPVWLIKTGIVRVLRDGL
jgi:hypothetical protein